MTAREQRRSSGPAQSGGSSAARAGAASGPMSAHQGGTSGFADQAAAASPKGGAGVQMKGNGGGDGSDKIAVAEAAIRGPEVALPHRAKLEASFGEDLSHVKAHCDPKATQAMGAEAFAYGDHIVLADVSPSLKLVAHEVTHVIQQREGVNLAGGVGRAGDAHEVDADAAAAKVEAGEKVQTKGKGGAAKLQRKELQLKEALQLKKKKAVSGKAGKRLEQAREAIAHTKSVMKFGAGNQTTAIRATNMKSNYRLALMRDQDAWEIDRSVIGLARSNREALTAAKADLAAGGNCGEHAAVAFDYLRVIAIGERITKASVKGLDHAFVLMGDLAGDTDADIVCSDPWPTEATATVWEDHFAFRAERTEIKRAATTIGDGKAIKEVIARGLKLSAKGEKMLEWVATQEKTEKTIDEAKDKHWLWDHPDAAAGGKDYDYVTEGKEEDKPAPGDGVAQAEAQGQDQDDESWWSRLWPF